MEVRSRENSPEIQLAITTNEAVPSAIGKGEICPRAIDGIEDLVGAWMVIAHSQDTI